MEGPRPQPTSARDRTLLLCAFVALIVASLIPIWLIPRQPLPDQAVHLAAASVLHSLHDPAFDFARYYDLSLGLNPYWGYYGPMYLLSFLFKVETANRVVLSLYAASLPIGTALLARRFDRSPWLGLFAFPIVWNYNFGIGFISFSIALGLLPFALASFDWFCERPTVIRGFLAALLGTAMYFCHLLPWGMYLGAAGLIGLLHRGRTFTRILSRLFVWSVSALVGIFVTLRGKGLHMGSMNQGITWKRYPTWQSIGELYQWTWDAWTGHEDEALAISLFLCWLALKLTSRRQSITLHDLRPEACFAVALSAYLILPRSVLTPAYWWGINLRFSCMAILFAGLCIQGSIEGRRRLLLIPLFLVALGFTADTTWHWHVADRFTSGYDSLAQRPEPGSRVLFILGQPWHDPTARLNYAHIYYDVYQAQRGGYMPWNFDDAFPLKYKARYPAPHWRAMNFDWQKHAPYYDYVMAFQKDARAVFPGHEKDVTLVAEEGKWKLFKLPGPRVDVSPGPIYPSDWSFDPGWRPPASPK